MFGYEPQQPVTPQFNIQVHKSACQRPVMPLTNSPLSWTPGSRTRWESNSNGQGADRLVVEPERHQHRITELFGAQHGHWPLPPSVEGRGGSANANTPRPYALSKSAGVRIRRSARGLSQARGCCTAGAQHEMRGFGARFPSNTQAAHLRSGAQLAEYLSFCDTVRPADQECGRGLTGGLRRCSSPNGHAA